MNKRSQQHKRNAAPKGPPVARLSHQTLDRLKELGYKYVVVQSYTLDHREDFIEMNHFVLKPIKELPHRPGDLGIFEPIDSPILRKWADQPDHGIIAFIEPNGRPI